MNRPVADATHAANAERYGLGPCRLEVSDWPYECKAKDKHPNHVVTVCRAHRTWWHTAP